MRYREWVVQEAGKGPNFAGRYRIAQLSCGSGCGWMVVVDARTGQLFREMPFRSLDVQRDPPEENYAALSFRRASGLLIAEGCFDVEARRAGGRPVECSRKYYRWVSPRFVILKKVTLTFPRRLR